MVYSGEYKKIYPWGMKNKIGAAFYTAPGVTVHYVILASILLNI